MPQDAGERIELAREDLSQLTELVRNENLLISQRMFWGLTLQGFLFASYFVAGDKSVEAVAWVLPVIGILTAASSLVGTWLAHVAMTDAMKEYDRIREEVGLRPAVVPGRRFPGILTILAPHFFIPVALAIAWLYILSSNHSDELPVPAAMLGA